MKAPLINLLLGILLSSCGVERVYTTGSYGSIKSYTEKQHFIDKKTTVTYVSGDVSFGKHSQDDGSFNDTKTIAAINIHRNTTGRFYNYYYGLGGAYGTYNFKEGYSDLIVKGEKSRFYTINIKSGINYTYTRPKVDWRFIGLEFAYLNEFGPYQDKLSELELNTSNDGSLIIANQKSMFTFHLYSEYVFKISDEKAFTVGFYLGDLLNYKNTDFYSDATFYSDTTGFSGLTLGLRLKKYAVNVIFETGQGDIKSSKIGLTYKL
ncbi:MAG: hypothetical protein ACM31G_01725 [Flavobacteriales bacterium]